MSKKTLKKPSAGGRYYRMPDGELITAAEYKKLPKAAKKPPQKAIK